MTKKIILSATATLAAAVTVAITIDSSNIENDFSKLEMANIEALSESEIGRECGGCRTDYPGRYCCTLYIGGLPWVFYHRSW